MEILQESMEQAEVTKDLLIQEIELEKKLQNVIRQEEESWRL